MNIDKGWILFLQAFKASKRGSLTEAAEWMYRLNVMARILGRHPIVDQIYVLKNELIKYLYQNGYSFEAKLQLQKFPCWGPMYGVCDEDCPKCGGTGVYRIESLYGLRFLIDGKRYAWHQPAKLINYPIKLTDAEPGLFIEPSKDSAVLKLDEAWLGCCVVWWSLLLHGHAVELMLFTAIRNRVRYFFLEEIKPIRELARLITRLRNKIGQVQRLVRKFHQERCRHKFPDTDNSNDRCKWCGIVRWRVEDDIPF